AAYPDPHPESFLPGPFAATLSLDALFPVGGADGLHQVDPGRLPDRQLEWADATKAIRAFVASLSPRDQEIVRRLFWQGQTQAEVASDLGVTKMAISKVMARITRLGRTALADYEHLALVD